MRSEAGGSQEEQVPCPGDPGPALLRESSLEFVRSLRDPLHAIALEAETLALAADADDDEEAGVPRDHRSRVRAGHARHAHLARSSRLANPPRPPGGRSGVRGAMRSHRLQRHIASVSRAITMLERVLRDPSDEPRSCDLTRVTTEACQFLRAFAARNGHRLRTDERAGEPAWAQVSESAARLTLVVVLAERLLALPRGSDLSVSVRQGPPGEIHIELEGEFEDGAGGTRHSDEGTGSLALERLLSSESIAATNARFSVDGPTRLRIRFRQSEPDTAGGQAGDLRSLPAQPGDSTGGEGPAQAQADASSSR